MMPTPDRLEAIQQREQQATKGPWRAGYWSGQCRKPEHAGNHPGLHGANPCVYEPLFYPAQADEDSISFVGIVGDDPSVCIVDTDYDELNISMPDMAFIAHAREDIPWLVQQVRDLQKQYDEVLTSWADCRNRLAEFEEVVKRGTARWTALDHELREAQARIAQLENERDNFVQQCGDWQIAANEFEQQLRAEREAHRRVVIDDPVINIIRQSLACGEYRNREDFGVSSYQYCAESAIDLLVGQLDAREEAHRQEVEKQLRKIEELERDIAFKDSLIWTSRESELYKATVAAEKNERALVAQQQQLVQFIKDKIADQKTCKEDPKHCESQSGPYCGAHDWWLYEPDIHEARKLLASLSSGADPQRGV